MEARNLDIEKMMKVAEVLKTIAHPVRLDVLRILESNDGLSVADIRERIGVEVEQSMLSHHLIKMKDKGVLTSVKEGKQIYYSIVDRQMLKIFDCMENCDFLSQ